MYIIWQYNPRNWLHNLKLL